MYANTCWGLLGLAVTLGVAVLGLTPEYGWLQSYLVRAAIFCGIASAICFAWYPFRWLARKPGYRRLKMFVGSILLLCGLGLAIAGLSVIASGDNAPSKVAEAEMLPIEEAIQISRVQLADVARFSIGDLALRNEPDQRLSFWANNLAKYVAMYNKDGSRVDPIQRRLIARDGKLSTGDIDSLSVKKVELDAALAQMRADYPNPQPGSITFHDVEGGSITRNRADSIGVAKSKDIAVDKNEVGTREQRRE